MKTSRVRRQGLEPRTRGLRVAARGAERCYDVPGCTANRETGCRVVPPAAGPYRDIRANMEQTWVRPIPGVHGSGGYGPELPLLGWIQGRCTAHPGPCYRS